MATKWGTFSEPGYLHPGVPLNKAFKAPKEGNLAGFRVLGCTKTGKVGLVFDVIQALCGAYPL